MIFDDTCRPTYLARSTYTVTCTFAMSKKQSLPHKWTVDFTESKRWARTDNFHAHVYVLAGVIIEEVIGLGTRPLLLLATLLVPLTPRMSMMTMLRPILWPR